MIIWTMPSFHANKNTLPHLTPNLLHSHVSRSLFATKTNVNNVKTLCKQGRFIEAFTILHLADHPQSTTTYASLLQVCGKNRDLKQGKVVHAHIIHTGLHSKEIFVGNSLAIMYTKCCSLADAQRVLYQMPERNVVSWTVIIAAYAKHGFAEEALNFFKQMQVTGVRPNEFTFASVVPACTDLVALQQGREVHEEIVRTGFESNVFVGSSLVDMYVKCGSLEDARKVFDKMPERDVVAWTAIVAGYAKNGNLDEALQLFQKMPVRDVVVWNAMIAGYAQNGLMDEASKLFQKMPNRNAMIAGYRQSNSHVDDAREVFGKVPERDVISWNAMISGYVKSGQFDEALNLFHQMQVTDVKPDLGTFGSVLPACANLAALKQGKRIHRDVIKSTCNVDVFVESALVDMYAKCGSIKDAERVFHKMPRRDIVSWNTMIIGYAMNGYGEETLELFQQMKHCGTDPDSITFLGVLSSCCNAGLVDQGQQYYDCMSRNYHITPIMEHYCCMVDLLGRTGHLNEAQDFIDKMPIKPDAAVWGSLLAACAMHGNTELGEDVAEHLFKLEPKNAAPYVLMSNIYAACGKWNKVDNVRKMMKEKRIKKIPGCSWIEVSSKVHVFLVGDTSHPETEKIYAELERLYGKMKEAGYIPNTNYVLHDVDEEQEQNISCHSEKLVIGFG